MNQTSDHTENINADSKHVGHLISYNERGIVRRDVLRIEDDDVIVNWEKSPETEGISDSFLYCETCNKPLSGDEIGIPDWEVR